MATRYQNIWYLYGVTSYGFQCAVPGKPGVYVRVTSFIDWIFDNTEGQIDASYTIIANPPTCRDSPTGQDEDTDTMLDEEDPLAGPSCSEGFRSNGNECVDINECEEGLSGCSEFASCTNTEGSFDCVCNSGYFGAGQSCVDINECNLETDDCHELAVCTNSEGSYSCACPEGYEGDGTTGGTGCTEIAIDIECVPNSCGYSLLLKKFILARKIMKNCTK